MPLLFRSSVRMFVRSFVEFMSKFWLTFLLWCVSHEPTIRNCSYLDHRYPIGFALFPCVRTPRSMPEGGARGQNLGHL